METIFRDRNNKPVYVTGLQAHNSSTGSPDLIRKSLDAVEQYGGNTLEAPVYWFQIEKEEGVFDFSSVRELIDQVRDRGFYLIILWFGCNKNGHPNYLPEYMKLQPEVYRMAFGPDGAPVPSISVHCRATLEKDLVAFRKFAEFVRDYDGQERTVLAIQIENEFGYGGTDRDYSDLGENDYRKGVPEALWDLEIPNSYADRVSKTWEGLFGRYANEVFSAWYHARFVEELAKAGKEACDLPFYCNIALGERGLDYPGLSYNAGAGVPRMIDVWKRGAPHLDLLCPDIYHSDKATYSRVCEKYDREDNALFIPETSPSGVSFAMDIILAAGRYHAIGVCGFGAESTLDEKGELLPNAREVAYSMRAISGLAPLLLKYRNSGRVYAFTQDEFVTEDTVMTKRYCITAQYIKNNPKFLLRYSRINSRAPENRFLYEERGRGILIQTDDDEFYLAGSGIGIDFVRLPDPGDAKCYAHLRSRMATQLNFLSVEEGHFEGDHWVTEYVRNGDESNFQFYSFCGQVVRIRINPNIGM